MPNNFVTSFEYVAGGGTIVPGTGLRDNSKTTEAVRTIAAVVNPVATQMLPGGNTALILSYAAGTSLLIIVPGSVNFGPLVLASIGATMDMAVSSFVSTTVIPTPVQVNGFYYSSRTLPVSSILDIVIPRYVAAMFLGGEL